MPNFSNIGLQEPSTITNRVAAVNIARGSTTEQQEILVIGDSESSLGIARVLNQAPNSTEWGLVVRPVGDSTQMAVSSVAGVVSVSPVSTASVRVAQSSAADLQATVTPASTVWAVQAAQSGSWTVRANLSSTSADNPVSAAQSGTWSVTASNFSTTVNVSSLAGNVRVVNSSAADLNVTVAGYSTTANVSSLAGRVAIAGYHQSGSFVNVTDSTNNAINVNVVAGAAGGSTIATISRIQDSSNNGIAVADSVNNAIRVNVVAGAAGGSTIVTVSTGSVRVHQSTAADLQMTAAQGGTWTVRANLSSTSADNPVTASQTGTWTVNLGTHLQSTAAPSSNSSGVIVRQVVDAIQTFASTAACASTSVSVQSSGANLRSYVTAFTVLTTVASATEFGFYTSNTLLWPLLLQAVSSGVTGANLAVGAPAYLFRTGASEELTFRAPASTVAGVRIGVSYFRAP